MKYVIAGLLLLLGYLSVSGQDVPDWVRQRPGSSLYYTGIGRALKSDKDYMQVAKQNAMKDLASEIKVEVTSSSLLHTLEEHERITSRFEETVRVSACENIENFHLVGSWQDDREYWVYYQLSIMDYEEYVERRRSQAIKQGDDYLSKGQAAWGRGELMTALELWLKGLETVQPVINEELVCEHDGRRVDVARELYNSVKTIFSGVTLRVSAGTVEAKAFQAVEEPVLVSLKRGDTSLKNVRLQWRFTTGDGRLSQHAVTDDQGNVKLYIENITSSLPRQEIAIQMDETPFRVVENGVFGGLVKEILATAPRVTVFVNIGTHSVRAYIQTGAGEDATVQRAVKNILTQHYFTIVNDPTAADFWVVLHTGFRKGEKERAGLSAVVAYYASATVKITRRESPAVVLDYVLEDVKVLQPETASATTARTAAVKELLKRLDRQLPERLKDVYAE